MEKEMKTLQVGLGNNPGGVESFVLNYYRELSSQKIQFDFICMYDKIAYEEEIRELGGHVYYVPNVKKDYFGYVREFRRVLEKGNYDVVHVNMLSAANIVPLRLAQQAGVKKVIAHSHSVFAPGLVRKLMNLWNRPRIGKYANIKAACGRKAGEWMFGKQAYENQEVLLIQNAISLEKYLFSEEHRKNIRESLGWQRKLVVGHVGRIEAEKNHKKIVEIFHEMVKKEPEAVLCLVGNGSLKQEIERDAACYGISEKVFFAGVRKDVERLLSVMDVFLFPSLHEALGFTLIEAQANGLPCVVSEAVPEEACIAGNVARLSLELGADVWAKQALKCQRSDSWEAALTRDHLTERHFNIEKEANALMRLYQE